MLGMSFGIESRLSLKALNYRLSVEAFDYNSDDTIISRCQNLFQGLDFGAKFDI